MDTTMKDKTQISEKEISVKDTINTQGKHQANHLVRTLEQPKRETITREKSILSNSSSKERSNVIERNAQRIERKVRRVKV